MKPTVFVLLLAFALGACASSKSATTTTGKGIDVETMPPAEAAQVVQEFQKTYGLPPVPPPDAPVTSMAQVLEIIRGDRLPEFEAARRYAAGRQGAEALTVRAFLELSYCGPATDRRVDSRRGTQARSHRATAAYSGPPSAGWRGRGARPGSSRQAQRQG
jgi:hypothetical protein